MKRLAVFRKTGGWGGEGWSGGGLLRSDVGFGFGWAPGSWGVGGEETRAVVAPLTEVRVETEHWFGGGEVVRGVDEKGCPFPLMSGDRVSEEGWVADGAKPDVGVESRHAACEGVVTPYEWGAVGVVWAEESPEVAWSPPTQMGHSD